MKILAPLFVLALLISAPLAQSNNLLLPNEKHLRNIKQLTFGGENAEAYFSADGKQLIFQATREGHGCDQIYTMNVDGSNVKMISNGEGRTTCSYFFRAASAWSIRRLIWQTNNVRRVLTFLVDTFGPSIRRLTSSPRMPTDRI